MAKRSKNIMVMCFGVLIVLGLIGYTVKVYRDIAFEQATDEKLYNITHPDPTSGLAGSSISQGYIMRAFGTGDYQYIVSHGKGL
jgi:hypothetical protein